MLAVGVCVWSKWKTRQEELKSEREKLEEVILGRGGGGCFGVRFARKRNACLRFM